MSKSTPIPNRKERIAKMREYLASAIELIDNADLAPDSYAPGEPDDDSLDLIAADLQHASEIVGGLLDDIAVAEDVLA